MKTSPIRAFAPRRRPCRSSSRSVRMRGSMRAPPASSTVSSTCRSARRTRMSSGRSVQAPSSIAVRQSARPRSVFARLPHLSHRHRRTRSAGVRLVRTENLSNHPVIAGQGFLTLVVRLARSHPASRPEPRAVSGTPLFGGHSLFLHSPHARRSLTRPQAFRYVARTHLVWSAEC